MPGEVGALHTGGEGSHAAEGGQFAWGDRAAREHVAECLEQRFRCGDRLPFHRRRHQRRRRLGDRAPRAVRHLKADVVDRVAIDLDVHLDPVAAQRVVAFGGAIRLLEPPEVTRVPVVVEDGLLIQIAEVAHHSARRARTIPSSCARSGATSMRFRISAANP